MTGTTAVPARDSGVIGPNAIVRTVDALRECIGAAATRDLLGFAQLAHYDIAPPEAMVPEADVTRLFRAMRMRLDAAETLAATRLAGYETANYILANRIPRAVQATLRVLPSGLAARLLLSSIAKHTWTFAGSAGVDVRTKPEPRIAVEGCPVCRGSHGDVPLCGYYAAAFEGLFRDLVCSRAQVEEIACEALGAAGCVFAIRF